MLLGIQILGIIFGLTMAYFCFLYYKRQEFGKLQFLFWEFLWFDFIFIILFPKTTGTLIQELSVDRAMDLFIILGFMFVAFLAFYNYTAVNKIRRNLEKKSEKKP